MVSELQERVLSGLLFCEEMGVFFACFIKLLQDFIFQEKAKVAEYLE